MFSSRKPDSVFSFNDYKCQLYDNVEGMVTLVMSHTSGPLQKNGKISNLLVLTSIWLWKWGWGWMTVEKDYPAIGSRTDKSLDSLYSEEYTNLSS